MSNFGSFTSMLNDINENADHDDTIIYKPIKFYGTLKNKLFVQVIYNYFPIDYADKLFEDLQSIQYNTDKQSMIKIMGRELKIPRKQTSYGDPKANYHFSGTSVKANDWDTSKVGRKIKYIAHKVGKTTCENFNYTLVNNYLDQTNCIGYHSDDEKELGEYPVVAGISLGQEREMYFKSNVTGEVVKVSLPHNSFYVMYYPTNKFWKHSIPRTTKYMGQRISLTFRCVKV
jgi:alkylated DNA repair dioxygenase AlkB